MFEELSGLVIVENFISEHEEQTILDELSRHQWAGNGIAYVPFTVEHNHIG